MARRANVGEGARRRLAQHEQDVAAEVAAASAEVDQVRTDTGVLVALPVGAIAPDPANPRKDLAGLDGLVASIEQYGVLQPVTVRPADDGEDLPEGVRYVLVMGERRHTAAVRAGLESIPAVVRSTLAEDRLPVQLLENLQDFYTVVDQGDLVQTHGLPAERAVSLQLDLARANAYVARDDEALRLLLAAEAASPDLVRHSAAVREVVKAMHRRAKNNGAGSPLYGLAMRCRAVA